MSSSLFASSSTLCQLPGGSTSDPTSCNFTADYMYVQADASGGSSYSGNTYNAAVSTDAIVQQLPGGTSGTSGGAYATVNDVFTAPLSIAGDSYQVTYSGYDYAKVFVGDTPVGFPLSGCTPGFDGVNCSFSLSASQLASVSTFTMTVSSDLDANVVNTYDEAGMSLTISQFDAAGNPVDFALAPEPGTVGMAACAFLLTGLMIRIRKAAAATVRIREQ